MNPELVMGLALIAIMATGFAGGTWGIVTREFSMVLIGVAVFCATPLLVYLLVAAFA